LLARSLQTLTESELHEATALAQFMQKLIGKMQGSERR
jgi:hypothetical protein